MLEKEIIRNNIMTLLQISGSFWIVRREGKVLWELEVLPG